MVMEMGDFCPFLLYGNGRHTKQVCFFTLPLSEFADHRLTRSVQVTLQGVTTLCYNVVAFCILIINDRDTIPAW